MKLQELQRKAIEHFGEDIQIKKACEELAELIQALLKDDVEMVKEEYTDVLITLPYIAWCYDIKEEDVDEIAKVKCERLLERINSEKENQIKK